MTTDADEQHLLEAVAGGVATLTLNRPDRLNAFSDPMLRALIAAPRRLAADAAALAARFASGPRVAYAETQTLEQVLELEATHQIRTAFTEDHKEATQAFVARGRPVFRGR